MKYRIYMHCFTMTDTFFLVTYAIVSDTSFFSFFLCV